MPRKTKSFKRGYYLKELGGDRYEVQIYLGQKDDKGNYRRISEVIRAASREEAVKKAEELRDFYRSGYEVDLGKLSVEEYVSRHIDMREKLGKISAQTAHNRRLSMRQFIYPRIGHLALAKLTTRHMSNLFYELQTEPVARGGVPAAPAHLKLCKSMLNTAFTQAVLDGVMPFNPLNGVKIAEGKKREISAFSELELAHFVKMLKALKDEPLKATITIALHSGMRKGEIIGLQWGDIDFTAYDGIGSITVVRSRKTEPNKGDVYGAPKTAKSARRIPMDTTLHEALVRWRDIQCDYIQSLLNKDKKDDEKVNLTNGLPADFPVITDETGGIMKLNYLSKRYRTFLKSIGMHRQGIGLHQLRHTHASYIAKQGTVNWVELAQRLGHSTPVLTMNTYAHVIEGQEVKVADAFADALSNAVKASEAVIKIERKAG